MYSLLRDSQALFRADRDFRKAIFRETMGKLFILKRRFVRTHARHNFPYYLFKGIRKEYVWDRIGGNYGQVSFKFTKKEANEWIRYFQSQEIFFDLPRHYYMLEAIPVNRNYSKD